MSDPPASQQLTGIALKVVSTLAFAGMATLVKLLSARLPIGEIAFFRSFFALVPVIAWVAYLGNASSVFKTRNLPRHMLRGAVGTGAMLFGFTALSMLPFADAAAISYAGPLLTVVLAVILLGEKVYIYRWSAVVIGMIGVLVILSDYVGPGAERAGLGVGALIALGAAIFGALAQTQARFLVRTDSAPTVVAFFSTFVAIASLFTLPFGWVVPGAMDLGLLVLTGILGGLGQVFLTSSYRFGDASTIAPFDYVSMIWAFLISFFIFGTSPTLTVLAGAAIVISAGLFVIYREHRLGIERAKSKPAQTPPPPLG